MDNKKVVRNALNMVDAESVRSGSFVVGPEEFNALSECYFKLIFTLQATREKAGNLSSEQLQLHQDMAAERDYFDYGRLRTLYGKAYGCENADISHPLVRQVDEAMTMFYIEMRKFVESVIDDSSFNSLLSFSMGRDFEPMYECQRMKSFA